MRTQLFGLKGKRMLHSSPGEICKCYSHLGIIRSHHNRNEKKKKKTAEVKHNNSYNCIDVIAEMGTYSMQWQITSAGWSRGAVCSFSKLVLPSKWNAGICNCNSLPRALCQQFRWRIAHEINAFGQQSIMLSSPTSPIINVVVISKRFDFLHVLPSLELLP